MGQCGSCGKAKRVKYDAVLVGGGTKRVDSIAAANAWATEQGKRLVSVKAVPV